MVAVEGDAEVVARDGARRQVDGRQERDLLQLLHAHSDDQVEVLRTRVEELHAGVDADRGYHRCQLAVVQGDVLLADDCLVHAEDHQVAVLQVDQLVRGRGDAREDCVVAAGELLDSVLVCEEVEALAIVGHVHRIAA